MGLGQHFPLADQKADRLSGAPLERSWRIKALHASPDAVAAAEGHRLGPIAEIHGVGNEGTARPGQFTGAGQGRLIGQREEAATGDVIHQMAAQTAGGVRQPIGLMRLCGVEQDPHRFQRGGAEHHQLGLHPLPGTAGPLHEHHRLGAAARAVELHMAHHRARAQRHPAGGQGLGQCSPWEQERGQGPLPGRCSANPREWINGRSSSRPMACWRWRSAGVNGSGG